MKKCWCLTVEQGFQEGIAREKLLGYSKRRIDKSMCFNGLRPIWRYLLYGNVYWIYIENSSPGAIDFQRSILRPVEMP